MSCLLLMVMASVQAVTRPRQNLLKAFAPMHAEETNAITCGSYETSSDGDGTAVVMYSSDGVWQFRFQLKTTEIEDNKEYTFNDMVDYQSFIREDGTWNFYSIQEATYKQWTETNGAFHVRADVTTVNGQKWTISYDKGSTQPSDDVCILTFDNSDVSLTDYIQLDETFQFLAKNSEAEIRITISSEQIEGVYDWNDFLPLYSGIYLFGSEGETTLVSFTDIHATVTPIEGKHNAYTCDFEGVGDDGKLYKTVLTYIPEEIEADSEEDIVAGNLEVLNFIEKEHQVIFMASNDTYGVSITVHTDELCSTWGIEDIDGFWSDISLYGDDGIATAMYTIKNGSITYEKFENGNRQLTGWVLGSNKVKYNLNLFYKVPESTRQETVTVEDARIKDLSGDPSEKTVRVQGTSADGKYFVSIMLDTETPTGKFTTDDFDKDYTYVDLLTADGFVDQSYALINGDIEITEDNGVYTVSGKLKMQNGSDVPEFNITIHALPQKGLDYDMETEGFEAEMTYIQVKEYDDEYGHYMLLVAANNGTAPENMLYLQFMIDKIDDSIGIPAGEYEINDSHETSTVVACEGVINGSVLPSFACNLTPEGQALLPMWFFRSGKVTVSKNSMGRLHVEVDAKTSYDQPIKIVADEDLGTGIESVKHEATGNKTVKKVVNGQLLIEHNGVTYTATGIRK